MIQEYVVCDFTLRKFAERGPDVSQLQNKDDPNLNMCPSDHPFISIQALENEGSKLIEFLVRTLWTTKWVDSICCLRRKRLMRHLLQ